MHEQKLIKGNISVDKNIADVVAALNKFYLLRTLESCENLNGRAFVCFVYGEDRGKTINFTLDFLGPRLVDNFGDFIDISVQMTTFKELRGELFFDLDIEKELAIYLVGIIEEY